jgi:hypothetical protein
VNFACISPLIVIWLAISSYLDVMKSIAALPEIFFCFNFKAPSRFNHIIRFALIRIKSSDNNVFAVLYEYMYKVFFDQTKKFCVLYIFIHNPWVYTSALCKCCRKKKQNNAHAFFRFQQVRKQCQHTFISSFFYRK